jgi:hypothetical protein
MTSDQLPTDSPSPTGPPSAAASPSAADAMLRDYHDARRHEDQWRIPQLLLALATPILTLLAVLFTYGGVGTNATIAGALAIVTGVGAALIAVEVWRWHRTAIGIANTIRTDYPEQAGLLLRDPL